MPRPRTADRRRPSGQLVAGWRAVSLLANYPDSMTTNAAAPLPSPDDNSALQLRGRLLIVLAGAIWSLGGMFFRLVEQADVWQVLFYRSSSAGLFLLAFLMIRRRGRIFPAFRDAGFSALLGGLFLAATFTFWLLAIAHTTVANALFLLSAQPFLATLLGWLVLGEKVRKATWGAMAVAMAGVALMVGDGLAGGEFLGDLFALGSAFGFACFTVAIRAGKESDQAPAIVQGAFFATLAAGAVCLIGGTGLAVSANDLTFSLLQGMVHIGLGFVFFSLGARFVAAGEIALLAQLEVVLGPIWVWIVVNEVPETNTLIGGAIVLAAVVANILSGMRRRRPPIGLAS